MATAPPPGEGPEKDRSAADVPVISASNPQPVVLEKEVPISQSLIWRWQREFYSQRGLKSWTEDMVPQFITNNPFFAEIYARMVFSFIGDYSALKDNDSRSPSARNPLRILELGAGIGKFAYLFLRQLEALLRSKDI